MSDPGSAPGPRATQRLDLWLFQARFFRSRSIAVAMLATGIARVNGQPGAKPGAAIGPGDVLTFPQGGRIRLVRVLALARRRGPSVEAQGLYLDLDSPALE